MMSFRSIMYGALFILVLTSCDQSKKGTIPIPPKALLGNSQAIAQGKELFGAHCAECHGSIAEGRTQRATRFNPAAPDFHERRYRKSLPGYLYQRIEFGNKIEPFLSSGSVMPSWAPHLSEEQIWSLVAYLRYRSGNVP